MPVAIAAHHADSPLASGPRSAAVGPSRRERGHPGKRRTAKAASGHQHTGLFCRTSGRAAALAEGKRRDECRLRTGSHAPIEYVIVPGAPSLV